MNSNIDFSSTLNEFLSSWEGEIFAIAAVDEAGGLGLNGQLLVKSKADMQYFALKTIGCTLFAGRKTADSIGDWRGIQPVLNQRTMYVATGGKVIKDGSLEYNADMYNTKLAVIGGAEIYSQALRYCKYVLLTRHKGKHKADTKFPMRQLVSKFYLDSTSYSTVASGPELVVQTWARRT